MPDSTKRLLQLQRNARRHAECRGYGEEADDFAQFMAEKFLAGRRGATIGQMFIDYLRQEYGDSRRVKSITTKNERRFYKQLTPANQPRSGPNLVSLSLTIAEDVDAAMRKIEDPNIRVMYVLYGLYGFTLDEIGWMFGMTGSAVCQKLGRRAKKPAKMG